MGHSSVGEDGFGRKADVRTVRKKLGSLIRQGDSSLVAIARKEEIRNEASYDILRTLRAGSSVNSK